MATASQVLTVDVAPGFPSTGRHVRRVDGRAAFDVDYRVDRLEHVMLITDAEGRPVAALNERITPSGRTIVVERPGAPPAVVRAVHAPGTRRRWTVTSRGGGSLRVEGGRDERQCRFVSGGRTVAETLPDADNPDQYRLVVTRPTDVPLMLAATMAIDHLSH
jgi:uncharacterized protein YxjI